MLAGAVLACALCWAGSGSAQDLQDRPGAPPPPIDAPATPDAPAPETPAADQVRFSAGEIEYDIEGEIVTATGEVRMTREGERLRADRVTWNRTTGQVVATGGVAVANPAGDVAYGDSIELTDTLKDGVVDNLLVVLEQGGRLAADKGVRQESGTYLLDRAAYTPCAVIDAEGCPKEPSWKVTAARIAYRPDRSRVYFTRPGFHLFGLPVLPLPSFSTAVGGGSDNGFLAPDFGYNRANGVNVTTPYYFRLAPNRGLLVAPTVFSSVLPMLRAEYRQLDSSGAFRIGGYVTASRRSDDLTVQRPGDTSMGVRGYLDGLARYQLSPEWSASGSLRVTTDRTFLRRYDISRDDRLRSTARVERIDPNSYLSITGWAVQTLRVNDRQGFQPIALPEIDYRRRFEDGLTGGRFEAQLNTLALTRTDGQDTQRAFASLRWDLRRLTTLGQEVTLTAYARADAYNTNDILSTAVQSYRGSDGFSHRAIGALAADVRWPFVGPLWGGTQRLIPRLQIVASPRLANLSIPNEDSRAVDLEDSNLFSLNRFPGYDRFEDSPRATYGVQWIADLPGLSIDTLVGQSYRLTRRESIFFDGTGLSDRFSDYVGRTEVRFRDFVSLTHRFRLDHDGFGVRRNEVDATVGTRATYALLGYIRLNRDIAPLTEDLQDREEVRVAGRVQIARFWSAFGSAVVDLTDRDEDSLSVADGFDPIRHRLGVEYEDDCLRLGFTWRRNYRATGDARAGNSFLLTLALTNLGR
ncbi:LPS-assembly protein LptD [uncultured Sphingomonas sp.]|uniref:LPS-assembly protein LptD n=1 Tax=uncultured Sphingomonas sp. TaxID=158754 RepID=UPI0035CA72CB